MRIHPTFLAPLDKKVIEDLVRWADHEDRWIRTRRGETFPTDNPLHSIRIHGYVYVYAVMRDFPSGGQPHQYRRLLVTGARNPPSPDTVFAISRHFGFAAGPNVREKGDDWRVSLNGYSITVEQDLS